MPGRRAERPVDLVEAAEAFLASAEENLAHGPSRYRVAYSEARHAVEVLGKCLLLLRHGRYPHKHGIGGVLAREGLVPRGVDRRELNRLLDHHTLGDYAFQYRFTEREVQEAVDVAKTFLTAVASWPHTHFLPPPPDHG